MRFRFLFCMIIVCFLCGCSKKEQQDEYLSLNELLATERSVENITKEVQQTSETVTDSTKEESTKEEATKEEDITKDSKESTSSETSDDNLYIESVPLHSSTIESTKEPVVKPTQSAVSATPVRVETIPSDYFYSDSYQTSVNTLVFSPHELYYENGKLHATMYVYNGHNTPATNIHNIYLSFDNGHTAIAEANFGTMEGCSIAPNCYVLWNFTFPNDGVYLNNSNLLNINTTYETTYNY